MNKINVKEHYLKYKKSNLNSSFKVYNDLKLLFNFEKKYEHKL